MRTINRWADWLGAMLDEPEYERNGQSRVSSAVLIVAASLGLAVTLVALTTLIALGLDALLQARFGLSSIF